MRCTKLAKLALVASISMALLGCELNDQASREKMLSDALVAAQASGDPMKAFQTVEVVKAKLCEDRNCGDHPLWIKAGNDEVKYLNSALERGDPKAFAKVYTPAQGNSAGSIVTVRDQPGNVTRFLAYADRLAGATPAEAIMLREAGLIVVEGRAAVRDTTRAANYLARAWAAGDKSAAGIASTFYLGNNDLRNAYLWSLRCTAPCARETNASLDLLQERLSPEAIKQAQRAAQDASIIELSTGG